MTDDQQHDVKIEDRLYDEARGVTVIRISYLTHEPFLSFEAMRNAGQRAKRVVAKGVAFCAPEDRAIQSKREGTFHAFTHALREATPQVAHEAFLALLRGGYLQEPERPSYGIGSPLRPVGQAPAAIGPITATEAAQAALDATLAAREARRIFLVPSF